ncbi:hypothetical protein G6F50_014970 [Rhizopus delemar]|uniref:Uncharacterized protein n=1 Tax=Rhizopus delemar TaxID=936053 RepID=A0A9P6Y0U2_9FUNG|nr:hypothetical protein G6F50_014970 [Rhizopus delemar]
MAAGAPAGCRRLEQQAAGRRRQCSGHPRPVRAGPHALRVRASAGSGRRAEPGRTDRRGDQEPGQAPGRLRADDRGRAHRPRQSQRQRLPCPDRDRGAVRCGARGQ